MTSAMVLDVYSIDPPGDTTTFLATLTNAVAKSILVELNGMGSGRFTINRNDAQATAANLAMGNLVKVRLPDVSADPIACFFLETGDFNLISGDEQGGEDLSFGGRGGLSYWDRAIWLPDSYTLPWWPACLTGGPSAGAKGAVEVKAGTYRSYNVTGSPLVITGSDVSGGAWTTFTTAGFCASFDSRRTFLWPDENNKRFLVHLSDGAHSGEYFHPHQTGVIEYLASAAVATSGVVSSVALISVGATPGAVLKYLWDEAQDAGRPVAPLPLMTVDFDDTLDSDGNAWATSDALAGLTANVGDFYLDTLALLVGTGVIDLVMGPDLDMHAYNGYGRDLTSGTFTAGKVRFEHAVNIAEALTRHVIDAPVATYALTGGTDDTFAGVELPDAASRVAREVFVHGASNVDATLQAVGLADLNLRLQRGETVSLPIVIGSDEAAGYYLPGPPGSSGHVWIGDTVTLHTGAGETDFDETDVQVMTITISEDDGGLVAVLDVRTGLGA